MEKCFFPPKVDSSLKKVSDNRNQSLVQVQNLVELSMVSDDLQVRLIKMDITKKNVFLLWI